DKTGKDDTIGLNETANQSLVVEDNIANHDVFEVNDETASQSLTVEKSKPNKKI
uniref:Uncharacterized protein n=1 Tax=Amphimedon queenslandica TaxID=400682 RepID=A0A1X7T4N0_AMPQE